MPRFIFALDSSALTAIALIWAPDLQLDFAVEHISYIVNSKLVCIFVAFIYNYSCLRPRGLYICYRKQVC